MSVRVMREAYPEVRPATSGFRYRHKGVAAPRGTSPTANEKISKINNLDLPLSALSLSRVEPAPDEFDGICLWLFPLYALFLRAWHGWRVLEEIEQPAASAVVIGRVRIQASRMR